MNTPDNTQAQAEDPAAALTFLAEAMTYGGSAAIERQEAQGQAQVVNSDVLPYGMDEADNRGVLEALGITVGDPVDGDPLFRHVTLPDGWTRRGTDHPQWSEVVDTYGRARVRVFYKAAFYDRKADAHVLSLFSYVGDCARRGEPVIYDDEWATPARIADAAAAQLGHIDDEIHRFEQVGMTDAAEHSRGHHAAVQAILDQARAKEHGTSSDED